MFITSFAWGGKVDPPLELLYAPENHLVAGALLDINPSGRLVFQRQTVLSGKQPPPEQIDVRVPMSVLKTVKIGRRYIFGYSTLRPDPRRPTSTIVDPNGAVLLSSIGLDPALFADTPQVRAILKAGSTEEGRESDRLFEQLMKALVGPDRALQNLAAGQIVQDPEIGEHLREGSGKGRIEKVARNTHVAPNVRTLLLVASATHPSNFGDWWQPAAVGIVTNTPVDGYSTAASDPTDLVLTALELLDQHAVKVSTEALKRWVWSPSPSLAEKASLMLRRESPAMERSVIQQALADSKLPEKTRKFLNDHLRRLDRLDAKSKAQKDGAG